MFEQLKKSWASLKRGKPGSRFHEQYERQQKKRKSVLGRALHVGAGVITLLLGLFFLPAPGPGFIIVLLGAVLIAREFEVAARFLDRCEVRGRQLLEWARRRWRHARA